MALLLGAVLVTGVGFLMASVGKDLISVMSWGVLALLVLIIPSVGILLPGVVSGWVRAIPSHYAGRHRPPGRELRRRLG